MEFLHLILSQISLFNLISLFMAHPWLFPIHSFCPRLITMPREVVLYSSSATGMLSTKKYITSIQNLLNAKHVPFTEIDCAVELEKRDAMAAISGTKVLPQVFVDGKYIGVR